MNNLERAEATGKFIHAVDQVADGMVNRILAQIWFLGDTEIEQVALTAGRLERAAYLMRGCCGHAMRHRIKQRRQTGEPREVARQMAALAERWGVDYTTLCKDIQMYETFHLPAQLTEPPAEPPPRPDVDRFFQAGAEPTPEQSGTSAAVVAAEPDQELLPAVVLEHLPPRYVEEECLRAPDPRAALEMAETKRGVPGYGREQLRADVDALRAAEAIKRSGLFAETGLGGGETTETLQEVFWQRVRLRPAERDALYRAARNADCSPEELILRWIEQGCLLLSGDAMESLQAQAAAYGQKRGRFNGADYLERVLRLRETAMVRNGEMTPTSLTGGERGDGDGV